MKQIRLMMGMPITVEIVDRWATPTQQTEAIDVVFAYFTAVDEKFSTYKETSEISQINQRRLDFQNASDDMKLVFALSESS